MGFSVDYGTQFNGSSTGRFNCCSPYSSNGYCLALLDWCVGKKILSFVCHMRSCCGVGIPIVKQKAFVVSHGTRYIGIEIVTFFVFLHGEYHGFFSHCVRLVPFLFLSTSSFVFSFVFVLLLILLLRSTIPRFMSHFPAIITFVFRIPSADTGPVARLFAIIAIFVDLFTPFSYSSLKRLIRLVGTFVRRGIRLVGTVRGCSVGSVRLVQSYLVLFANEASEFVGMHEKFWIRNLALCLVGGVGFAKGLPRGRQGRAYHGLVQFVSDLE